MAENKFSGPTTTKPLRWGIMKKLIWLVDTSLDGFMSGPNGELEWLAPDIDAEFWDDVNGLLATVDTTLFGRITYQNFEQYWPAVPRNPASPNHELEFSRWIEKTPKYVASTTLTQLPWNNSTVLRHQVLQNVSQLKQQSGKRILMFGSCNLAIHLLDAKIIDEIRLRIHPIVLGAGRLLFKSGTKQHTLKLEEAKKFASGVMSLHYRL